MAKPDIEQQRGVPAQDIAALDHKPQRKRIKQRRTARELKEAAAFYEKADATGFITAPTICPWCECPVDRHLDKCSNPECGRRLRPYPDLEMDRAAYDAANADFDQSDLLDGESENPAPRAKSFGNDQPHVTVIALQAGKLHEIASEAEAALSAARRSVLCARRRDRPTDHRGGRRLSRTTHQGRAAQNSHGRYDARRAVALGPVREIRRPREEDGRRRPKVSPRSSWRVMATGTSGR